MLLMNMILGRIKKRYIAGYPVHPYVFKIVYPASAEPGLAGDLRHLLCKLYPLRESLCKLLKGKEKLYYYFSWIIWNLCTFAEDVEGLLRVGGLGGVGPLPDLDKPSRVSRSGYDPREKKKKLDPTVKITGSNLIKFFLNFFLFNKIKVKIIEILLL